MEESEGSDSPFGNAPRQMGLRRVPAIEALLVGAASLATAWNSRRNGFVWDDRAAILGNRDVDAAESQWWELFQHDFWGGDIDSDTSHKSYRPLTVMSFRWNRSQSGLNAHAFHFTNVWIHAICSILVWQTARVVLQTNFKRNCNSTFGTLLGGMLFAVHPVHSDAIASIVGRADMLCVMFALAGFLTYASALTLNSWSMLGAANVLAILACLSKELGFTVFGIFVVFDLIKWSSGDRPLTDKKILGRVVCQLVLGAFLFLIRLRVNGSQTKAVFNILANSVNIQESRTSRLLSYAHIHAWYLWKLLWPGWLSYDYGFNTIPVITHLVDSRNLLTAVAYAAVLIGTVHGVRHNKNSPMLMCIAFGVLPFIPASNLLFPVGTVLAERLLYFPSVGFCLIIGHIANCLEAAACRQKEQAKSAQANCLRSSLLRGAGLVSVLLVVFILIASSYKSAVRNAEWKNEETLFVAALDVVPENVKVLNNAAKTLLNRDPDRAFKLARAGLAILPNHVEGQSNLGLAHTFRTQTLLAIRHMMKAFSFGAKESSGAGYAGKHLYSHWSAQYNSSHPIGRLLRSPTVDLAKKFLETAVRRGSRTPLHYYELGIISEHFGDIFKALRFLEEAKRLNEQIAQLGVDDEMLLDRPSLHNYIAVVKRHLGRGDEALSDMLAGLDLYPTDASLYFNVASIYISRGMHDWAATFLKRCLVVCRGASTLYDGARLLGALGHSEAAQTFFKRAAAMELIEANLQEIE